MLIINYLLLIFKHLFKISLFSHSYIVFEEKLSFISDEMLISTDSVPI